MSVNGKMTAIADAIRAKSGKTGLLTLDAMADEIGNLSAEEIIQHANIPDYVKEEALRVANLVEAARKNDSIVFLATSDNHYYGAQAEHDTYADQDGVQTDVGNQHAAMAAKILAYALKIDFMAQLGDITWGSKTTTSAVLKQQYNELMGFLRESHKDIPCFHAIGNHDTGIYYHNQQITDGKTGVYTETGEWLYSKFTALSASDDTVFGGIANGGYCYRDFPSKKLRVFLLNTSEALVANQQDRATLGSQRKWFADALINLNSKADAADWQWLLLSHYPADYGNAMPLSELLKAYVEGGSITIALESGSSSTVNFSGKNSAKMVAQFHGHVHNFLTSKLYSYATGKGVKYDAWRVCIPNAQYNRENYYTTVGSYADISFKDAETYSKTANSAKDTSFVVNVVNPSEQKIHSICYGAGIDRVVGYAATVYYSVNATLTNVTLTGGASSVEAGQPYTATLTIPSSYEWGAVTVTMGGTDITASAYSNGVINIPAVTGNVIINASASEIETYTNWVKKSTDADGNVIGYKSGVYVNSSGTEASRAASYSTGFIPCKGNGKSTIYLKNVGFQKSASDATYQRITFYDSSKTYIVQINANADSALYQPVKTDDGTYTSFKIRATTSGKDTSGDLFIRISASYLGADSVITVDEPIE